MPAILRAGPFRFFFYASDRGEPPHIHVERDNRIAKFWLDPVRLQRTGGLRRHELRRIERIIEENQTLLLEAWDERFNP
jgi:hypothetical protein